MSIISIATATSIEKAITATAIKFSPSMRPPGNFPGPQFWQYVANTDSWVKQANPSGTYTGDTNANMADGDTVTISDGAASVIYEYDKSANGVTGGHIAWAAGTTAASVAANLATAIRANQAYITVVDNLDGTLTLSAISKSITMTKSSASALAVSDGPVASAGAGSVFVPAKSYLTLDSALGADLSAVRDTADGKASLAQARLY